ncbi:MAG: hypothetical protein M1356_07420 [Gammaproteobacteria bacterium]|nr:hypothetical protein [Gammaproteobacteria bacterium]
MKLLRLISFYLPCVGFALFGSIVTQAAFNGISHIDWIRALFVGGFVLVMLILIDLARFGFRKLRTKFGSTES